MSLFKCYECDEIIDGDWEGCEQHPFLPFECVCTECYYELNGDEEDGRESENSVAH